MVARLSGEGSGGHPEKLLQEGLNAEAGESGAEEHRGQLAVAHCLQIQLLTGPVQQLQLVPELVAVGLADDLGQPGIVQSDLLAVGGLGAAVGGEVENPLVGPVIDALEVLAAADGPVHRAGVDAQLVLDLLAQVEGIPGLPIHLVDEGEDGNVPHGADLEQLPGLGFHALGGVDDHDGGVGGHQGPIGVLGEVLVARGVQNVDAVALILELHHRAGDRDTSLLLDLHPVRGGGPGVALALDHAGLVDGASVEQELLGQGGLTGVRVRDNGKGAAAVDFGIKI